MNNKFNENEMKEMGEKLQIINHAAKVYKDAKRELKKVLFENEDLECIENEVVIAFLAKNNIKGDLGPVELNYRDYYCYNEKLSKYTDANWYVYGDTYNDVGLRSDIIICYGDELEEYMEKKGVEYDYEDAVELICELICARVHDIKNGINTSYDRIDIPNSIKNKIENSADFIYEEICNAEIACNELKRRDEHKKVLHNFLHSIGYIKNTLYDIKSVVINKLGVEPIEIHRFNNDDYNLYPLYEIGGKTFHQCVDSDNFEDVDVSEMKCLEEKNVCYNFDENVLINAIDYFLDFLEIKDKISVEQILSGTYYKIDKMTGIEIERPYYKTETEKNDGYDEYDDYYWD